ncbi:MAG TPA: ABC transporter permease [Caldilineae bacterium]|nr:ABC transporter permease [Caldilineae bacterium]
MENPPVTLGLSIMALMVLIALFAPWIAPHDPYRQELAERLQPPFWMEGGSWEHPLGTDDLGRDILSRMVFGVRVSLLVGGLAVLLSGSIGVSLGLLSGYFGSWVDDLLMRVCDVQLSIPLTLLAIAVIAVVGSNLPTLIGVLGLTQWVVYARIVRGEALALREKEFVEASRAIGATDFRIIRTCILPNTLPIVLVTATLRMAVVIMIEAGLSYLGLGIQPPKPSLGSMLSEGRQYLATAWWLGTFPGMAIMLIILGINLLGDGLRDLLDPRSRRRA